MHLAAWGNIAASSRRVKRLSGHSSISHAGFMLIAIAADNELAFERCYLLIPYSAISIGASRSSQTASASWASRDAQNLDGFGGSAAARRGDVHVHARFAGFPHRGFMGKFSFLGGVRGGMKWLVIVGVVATLVSL